MNLLRGAALLTPSVEWGCAHCPARARTSQAGHHVRFHTCRGGGAMAGLWAPMARVGVRCEIRAVEREDYIGREDVQTNAHGRPVMSVITTRDDGQDCAAYAPCATARME